MKNCKEETNESFHFQTSLQILNRFQSSFLIRCILIWHHSSFITNFHGVTHFLFNFWKYQLIRKLILKRLTNNVFFVYLVCYRKKIFLSFRSIKLTFLRPRHVLCLLCLMFINVGIYDMHVSIIFLCGTSLPKEMSSSNNTGHDPTLNTIKT